MGAELSANESKAWFDGGGRAMSCSDGVLRRGTAECPRAAGKTAQGDRRSDAKLMTIANSSVTATAAGPKPSTHWTSVIIASLAGRGPAGG